MSAELSLKGKRIILGVTGSVAAYKAADLASKLTQMGASVHAILTKNACEFISPLTFRSVTGNPPLTGLFDEPCETGMAHIDIPTSADLLLISPATANIIGKIANGIADDWLSTAAMVVRCPILIAPAMNCNMYTNPIVTANIEKLKTLGHRFIDPDTGHLACGTEGVGRLADIDVILTEVMTVLKGTDNDLSGMRILIMAGPTREAIDPVRFISNYSSGKMGFALAEAAARRGAEVTLVTGPTELKPPDGVECIEVVTAKEMAEVAFEEFDETDAVIAAAAVADYTPAEPADSKIKKSALDWSLKLRPTEDILKTLGKRKKRQILVGFAAETENLKERAIKKLQEKNLDLIIANPITSQDSVFGSDTNEALLIAPDGSVRELPRMTKRRMADEILDYVKEQLWRSKT